MKLLQKIRYVFIGALGMTAAIPLILKATDAIPLTFRQGDVLSAEILNTLFGRLNDVTLGFQTVDDLEGTWSCTMAESKNSGNCHPGTMSVSTPWSLVLDGGTVGYYSASTNVTFTKQSRLETSISSSAVLGGCGAYRSNNLVPNPALYTGVMARPNSLFFDVPAGSTYQPNRMDITKLSPTSFRATNDVDSSVIECRKINIPPTPPTALVATLSGSSVSLTWDDQSTDETGFKVQTKNSVGGSWVTLTTTPADVQSYTAVAATGNNWYRVLATNANGDSITSNEILVER
jgi:hypothetical protein